MSSVLPHGWKNKCYICEGAATSVSAAVTVYFLTMKSSLRNKQVGGSDQAAQSKLLVFWEKAKYDHSVLKIHFN